MSKEMVISANPHETRVAILEEGQLCEYYVEREKEFALVGSIYKGRVTRVLPGMQSAFVEIGLDSDAFLYVSDFLEDIEEFDHIVTTVEDKVQKMEAQGGQVFAATGATAPALEPADVESGPLPTSELTGAEPTPAASIPLAPPVIAREPSHAPTHDRPRFENRPPGGGDRGGRNFRGRGGRGRNNRRGGPPRGGDNRYGRELPSSKYAPSRSFESGPSDAPAGEGHISVVLPGESLAKFREKTPGTISGSASAAPVSDFVAASPETIAAPESQTHESTAPESTGHEPAAHDSAQHFAPASAPPAFPSRPPYGSGLEPLPGETLSKWKTHQHLPPEEVERADALPVPDAVRFAPLSPLVPLEHTESEEHSSHESDESHNGDDSRAGYNLHPAIEPRSEYEPRELDAPHDERLTPDLSEDEASALAEHIADAQDEEAARVVQDRAFSAEHDAADEGVTEHTGDAEHSEADDTPHEAEETEDAELAEEEADAEGEGMIAPPSESEHADEHAEQLEAEAAAENVTPISGENPQPAGQPFKARVRDDFRSRMQHPARRGGQRDRGRRDDRGRRPQHSQGHHRPQQPRRTQLIADMLKQGQEIIVQIAKEPLGKKGARITSHIALPGRFLVYMPTLDHTGVSRKIASAEDRSRLRHLVNDAKGAAGGGFIVRTAAGSATPEEVRADVEFLTRTWTEIRTRSEQRKAPSLLHRDLNLVERILRDYITPDFGAIWVDTEEEYTKVVDFMSRFQPQLVNRVKLYTKETPVFEEFGIQQEIDKGLRPKVWLKSGGYIVINHTEALVAIDVNTGKFVGKGSNRLEDTIVRTNLEAVKEIVRQMRLRDLGGIIVIDFIDMEERRNREKVMAALEDALRADRAPSKVLRFNEFGLVAITRKRTKQALERTLCQPCPYCTGSGMVKSIPTLCYEIQTEARKMAPEVDSGSLTLRVHPEISKALKTRESSLIEELERWTKKSIIIQADPTLHWEQYDIY
jgi:Rne/Rng family ribonuclease